MPQIHTLHHQLSLILRDALERTGASGSTDVGSSQLPEAALRWEIPKDSSYGDISNSVAFKLAAKRKQAPQRVAEELAKVFLACADKAGLAVLLERVEARSGFLNVFLSQQTLIEELRTILKQRARYGTKPSPSACAINIEFVSANPTGPLSVAHGRQAVVGDVLARLLRCQGYRVTKEYYLNDEGRQIEMLGKSLRLRYLELLGQSEPFPEDGYHGAYIYDIAKACIARYGKRLLRKPEAQSMPSFMEFAQSRMLEEIKRDLARAGLSFNRWTSQRWLRTSGRIDAALGTLKDRGALYEADGATWFASTKFGDDKDRVVLKRDGELTYLAPDIAYHQWKFQQGYDQLLNLWGPDHHGYIMRLRAAVSALGFPAERLAIRIVQLVTLSRCGRPVPMSKRQGEFVTFREVLDEVGVDATRFFFVMRTMESHLDFDLDLAKSQSQENPVYYVQYAHARICSIYAKTPLLSVVAQAVMGLGANAQLLREPEELLLMRALFQYPMVLRLCAAALEPHGLTVYLRKLSEVFHVFYTKHRVITEDRRLSAARLALVQATRIVLANGLGILGVSAPGRM
jgi:arginyl-tRNA synthetase